MREKNCLICGGAFEAGHGRQLYCSPACRRQARRQRGRERRRAGKQDRSRAGLTAPCRRCRYFNRYESCCDYLELTGVSRLALHRGEEGSINDPCREFQARERGHRIREEIT